MRPRVLQVVLSLCPGGTERLVIEIVKRLAAEVDSAVCCLDEPGAWAGELTARGIPVTAIGRRPGFRPSVGLAIAREADRHGAGVLHCHQYSPFVYGRVAALARRGLRIVFTEHGRFNTAPPSWKRRLVNPLLGRLPGRIFAVSAALRDHMLAEGLPARRVEVLRNGIEPGDEPGPRAAREARAALGLPADAFVVGTAARLDPIKDLATLVRAMALLLEEAPRARLVVVGDGPERASLEAAARSHGIEDATAFLGHRQDVRGLLPALDAYVNSSLSEGISVTILEAMAAALPVVATEVGGNPEVVRPETGDLVPASDARAIAGALSALARDPARARALGAAGRRRLLERFDIARMAAGYLAAYRGDPAPPPEGP